MTATVAADPAATAIAGAPDPTGWPPELQLLLGDEAAGLLGAAVDAAGGRLRTWAAKQVTHDPARSTVVQYRAEVGWPGGRTSTETLVAATGRRIPEGAAVFEDGSTRVAVWRWPHDPALPGLGGALDRVRIAALLDDLGVDGGAVGLRVRAYRPGRRAVVEATGRRGRLFLKVVRPGAAEDLHRTHRALAQHLPVPDSLGWTADGIVVLPALGGSTLREVLRSSTAGAPAPGEIVALLDRLPDELATRPARRSLVDSATHHAAVLASALPDLAGRVEELAGAIAARPLAEHPVAPVHGDLYEAQLLVDRGRITGLLDVDTAGAGHRVEDLANLCAHLSVLATVSARPAPVLRYGAAVLAHAEATFDRADLRTRIAAGVLGLATGPFRVLEDGWPLGTARRLDLAARWLDGAGGR